MQRAQNGARIGGAEREVASAQGWDAEKHLHGSGTFRWPRQKAKLLVPCAVHVCESRDSMEVWICRIVMSGTEARVEEVRSHAGAVGSGDAAWQ